MRGNHKFDALQGGSLYGQKKASRIKFLQKEFIMEKNCGQFGKTVSREVELKLKRKSLCMFCIPQEKMSDAAWAAVYRVGDKFYEELELHEKAAFGKSTCPSPQAKMSEGVWAKVDKNCNDFYKKLEEDNIEVFEKMAKRRLRQSSAKTYVQNVATKAAKK